MTKTKLLKDKNMQTIALGIGANILALAVILKQFDLISSVFYLAIALLAGKIIINKRPSAKTFFVIGALAPLAYNLTGVYSGWFPLNQTEIIISAVQGGLVSFLVAKMRGAE